MNITIDPEVFGKAAADAMAEFTKLDGSTLRWPPGKAPSSPLQDCIARALRSAAQEIAEKQIKDDAGFSTMVRLLVAEAFGVVFEKHREKTVERMADYIGNALERYDD
jgi:hypothetical protein